MRFERSKRKMAADPGQLNPFVVSHRGAAAMSAAPEQY
jgi:hypothetical protein